ncbi:hypothetical protein ABZ471_45850 [Streptomyces sp. NPDC005728]|uniref:hypothetical protein n=1 Tax=Streptomyces sp. NPDC005728 TaxID=3157054 RepID=UPI0033D3118E
MSSVRLLARMTPDHRNGIPRQSDGSVGWSLPGASARVWPDGRIELRSTTGAELAGRLEDSEWDHWKVTAVADAGLRLLSDGTEITFSGTTADQSDMPGHDVSTHHPVQEHGSWQASLSDANGDCGELYDSHTRSLPHEEDTGALVAAILTCAREHGGSDRTVDPND